MAKITLENGMVIEGTIGEFKEMGVKFPVEEAQDTEPLKVGDYAKVVGFIGSREDYNGTIVRLDKEWSGEQGRYNVTPLGESSMASCDAKNLVKATEDEIEAAKRQQAEISRWSAIGRKPNEFKTGDIVRNGGEIFEVENGSDKGLTGAVGVRMTNYKWRFPENIELISPVEARFDKVGSDRVEFE